MNPFNLVTPVTITNYPLHDTQLAVLENEKHELKPVKKPAAAPAVGKLPPTAAQPEPAKPQAATVVKGTIINVRPFLYPARCVINL